ncbi:MAG: zonular occludens toxin domain-containing protein [Acutalibacteraceae bacterium]|nr:zonular occludens toxin domain-containing protein [Acutalibacteraceae bacterium]
MISLYSGTPGSYKSYHAVCDVLSWLRRDKNVIANFPVDATKYFRNKKISGNFIFKTNTDLTVDYLLEFAKKNHKSNTLSAQTLVVIDEASILFNPRQFDRKDRAVWINFFANHRHFNYEFILIAQSDRMIDRQVRCLLEYDIKHRALKNWNLTFAIISLVFKGLFHCVEYWYPCRLKTSTSLRKFNKRIASCYDTMSLFNIKDDEDKSSDDKKEKEKNSINRDKLISKIKKKVSDENVSDTT